MIIAKLLEPKWQQPSCSAESPFKLLAQPSRDMSPRLQVLCQVSHRPDDVISLQPDEMLAAADFKHGSRQERVLDVLIQSGRFKTRKLIVMSRLAWVVSPSALKQPMRRTPSNARPRAALAVGAV